MADPRFFDNRGPFKIGALCDMAAMALPAGVDRAGLVFDVAGLAQAGPRHLSFLAGPRAERDFESTQAGWCIVGRGETLAAPLGTLLVRAASVPHAFAFVARQFYPAHEMPIHEAGADIRGSVHSSARLGAGVVLAPGVVIGAGAEIGSGTKIGANSVIGPGVSIGQACEIGAHVSLSFALIGDGVVIQAGARIGGSGFGFASDARGHSKIPQLGRVIVQDRVEVGANTAIDRGALADTIIGEGSKIDNLVQIGHNTVIGRHCVIVGQAGISGSVTLGDFVVIGGNAGIADHVTIGDGARVAAKSGVTRDLAGGKDYGGFPAKPAMEWRREMATLARITKSRKQNGDG